MRNSDKFIEVFGEKTFERFIKAMCEEELTVGDVVLWFHKSYSSEEETPAPKRRGRPRKNAIVERKENAENE